MKKIIVLAAASFLLGACGTMNKNTVSYQMSKIDASKYYVVAGDGANKKASARKALDNMKKELSQHTPQDAQEVLADLIANATVKKTWRDTDSVAKHYYSLAVLSRENAHKILTPRLNQTDAQLGGLAQQFSSPADPLADLKVVYKMQPLVQRRRALDEVYQFVDANSQTYMPDTFNPYKDIFKQKLSAVKVGIEADGDESDTMVTYVTDALTKMGFGVVDENHPNQVLTVQLQTKVNGYDSQKVNGLIWCNSSAAVNLVDCAQGTVFSSFNVSQRAGTTRRTDSLQRSMQAAGQQAAQEVATRLENYLKNK